MDKRLRFALVYGGGQKLLAKLLKEGPQPTHAFLTTEETRNWLHDWVDKMIVSPHNTLLDAGREPTRLDIDPKETPNAETSKSDNDIDS